MNRRTKIIVSVAGIFIVLLALLGLTYAYFLTRINGNTNDKSISVSTAKLELTYSDNSSEILGSGKVLQPSNEPIGTKTFTVTNNGGDTNYSVVLENLKIIDATNNGTTTFESNDFRYTLECTNCENQITEQTVFPLTDGSLLNNNIAAREVHNYTLTLWYLETGLDQSEDMNKTLSAKINIIDPNKENPYKMQRDTLAYNIINDSINRKNGIDFRTTPLTVAVSQASTKFKTTGELSKNISIIGAQSQYQEYYWTYGTGYVIDENSGKFSLTGVKTCKYNEKISGTNKYCYEELVGKYVGSNDAKNNSSSTDELKNTTELESVYKVAVTTLNLESTVRNRGYKVTSVGYYTPENESELSIATDNYGTSYYYRGNVKSNYLELNNMCFRIVRIEGDGSIKITLAKEGLCSSITESDTTTALINDGALVEYGYNNDGVNNTFNYTGYNGGLYTSLVDWYNANLKNIEDKLKDETWCLGETDKMYDYDTGQLLTETPSSKKYYYETGKRLWIDLSASYKCSAEADSVTGYVGTLTADEVAYAGGTTTKTVVPYYLIENAKLSYLTMSPADFFTDSNGALFVESNGHIEVCNVNDKKYAVRPAITLKPGVVLSSGDGTRTNPYKIVEN